MPAFRAASSGKSVAPLWGRGTTRSSARRRKTTGERQPRGAAHAKRGVTQADRSIPHRALVAACHCRARRLVAPSGGPREAADEPSDVSSGLPEAPARRRNLPMGRRKLRQARGSCLWTGGKIGEPEEGADGPEEVPASQRKLPLGWRKLRRAKGSCLWAGGSSGTPLEGADASSEAPASQRLFPISRRKRPTGGRQLPDGALEAAYASGPEAKSDHTSAGSAARKEV